MSPPIEYIELTRTIYAAEGFPPYHWSESRDVVPLAPPRRPLAETRVALVASGGIYRAGHVAFHFHDDTSLRLIPKDVPTDELRTAHFAYDQTDARADPNCVFPIDPLRALEQEGFIGELAPNALTFMGGIYSARRVLAEVAPRSLRQLQEMEVGAALLVPV